MKIACIIAFTLSIIVFGLPSQRNFKDFAGSQLIWRSKWYLISTIIHGLIPIGVLFLLIEMGISINFYGKEKSFIDHPWIYGIFAGLFYPGFLYSLIGTLSAVGVSVDDGEENVKSSMDFYSSTLGKLVKIDIYKIANRIVDETTDQLFKMEDLTIEDFLISFCSKISSEDAGKAKETYERLKKRLENLQHPEDIKTKKALKESSIEQILLQYLVKHGKKRYQIDLLSVMESLEE